MIDESTLRFLQTTRMIERRTSIANLTGVFVPLKSPATIEPKWRALEVLADCSFFLSWSWIGTWLRLVANRTSLLLYECRHGDELVALGVVSGDLVRRRKLFRSRTFSLNEAAQSDLNVFIEYNGLLARSGYEAPALEQFIGDLARHDRGWDELRLTNLPQRQWATLKTLRTGARLVLDVEHATWITPLDEVSGQESLLLRMSANRRSKIRRTFKEYEKQGALCVDNATTPGEALDYFRSLGVLHTARWNRAGLAGSFANPAWVSFHEDLIASAFPRGEIQLLRIRCGSRAIGYLYNFLWRGDVLMLQSGFASESSNILRPGYVSHILAMQFNAQHGAKRYDFLIGDSEYKEVLADAGPPLTSGRVQRTRVKFIVEDVLVSIYRKGRRSLGISK